MKIDEKVVGSEKRGYKREIAMRRAGLMRVAAHWRGERMAVIAG